MLQYLIEGSQRALQILINLYKRVNLLGWILLLTINLILYGESEEYRSSLSKTPNWPKKLNCVQDMASNPLTGEKVMMWVFLSLLQIFNSICNLKL